MFLPDAREFVPEFVAWPSMCSIHGGLAEELVVATAETLAASRLQCFGYDLGG